MRNYCSTAWDYINDVLNDEVPACKYVKQACQRQMDDLERFADGTVYTFSAEIANRVCSFIELLPHVKGPKAGEPILLEPWQIFIVTTVFGWVKPDGNRRFRRVYIEVPRGNGKSALSSAIGLYMLAADSEGGAEIYSFATTRDQAKIVFGDAQNMVRKQSGLRSKFGVAVGARSIHVLQTASKFEALSSEGSTLDGLNTHLGIIDELHAHKTRAVYDVVETSIGKRSQSMLWIITTAGSNRAGICYEVRGFVGKILQGASTDESQFGIIYGIDATDDWTSPEALIKANPNYGISVMPDVIKSLQEKAMDIKSASNNFKTKHLNEWVNADVAWMDMRKWDAGAVIDLNQNDFVGQDCFIGVDLASKVDLAVIMLLFEKEGMYYVFGEYFLPRETVDKGENSQYAGWELEGRLTTTPGGIIDFAVIEQKILEICKKFNVIEIAYDPFQATQMVMRLANEGLNMVEVRPTVLNFSEPMKQVEALVIDGKLKHNSDPILTWNISNTVCHVDAKDNIYPRKDRVDNKIDGVVALIMAMNRQLAHQKNEADISGFLSAPISGKYNR